MIYISLQFFRHHIYASYRHNKCTSNKLVWTYPSGVQVLCVDMLQHVCVFKKIYYWEIQIWLIVSSESFLATGK
jgi:hypothetical protein